jgi:SHS2 domain-containing protein
LPFKYLEDIAIADAAFLAWGATLEELFVAAADATTGVMIGDLDSIRCGHSMSVQLEENDLEWLLFQFLQEIIFLKDAEQLLVRVVSLVIEQQKDGLSLRCVFAGDRIDPSRHELLVDVKAVTLHRFRVERAAESWEAQVVLDV